MVGLVTHSVEVTWLLDDITMRGTLTVPPATVDFRPS